MTSVLQDIHLQHLKAVIKEAGSISKLQADNVDEGKSSLPRQAKIKYIIPCDWTIRNWQLFAKNERKMTVSVDGRVNDIFI